MAPRICLGPGCRGRLARSLWIAISAAAGCAAPRAVQEPPRAIAPAVEPIAEASGVWDWIFRSSDDQGDMRVEQEEWHLEQHGTKLDGYYDRAVTMVSTDERLFRCNQRLGFTKTTRVRVSGHVQGEQVMLREISFETRPGPCDDGARNLVAYMGVLRGSTLSLRWGPEAGQTLVRRAQGGHGSLAQLTGFPIDAFPPAGGTPTAPTQAASSLEGIWQWELRSIDAEGDERLEREEWHLSETSDGIRGYYDRTVTRVRADGTFGCNGEGRHESSTRYTITGQRFGDKLTLTEVDYRATPNGCDNALRRLDTYQGQLADADSIVLTWGPGNQLLRRAR